MDETVILPCIEDSVFLLMKIGNILLQLFVDILGSANKSVVIWIKRNYIIIMIIIQIPSFSFLSSLGYLTELNPCPYSSKAFFDASISRLLFANPK